MGKIFNNTPAFRWVAPDTMRRSYSVHGQRATSYEWNVAWALDRVGLEYLFQVDYLGGRRLRGGMVVDFLVYTKPLSTPLWVNGDYWHTGRTKAEDELKKAKLYSQVHGECNYPITFWGKDCETKEVALSSVKRTFL